MGTWMEIWSSSFVYVASVTSPEEANVLNDFEERLVRAPVRKLQELLSGWFSLVKYSQALIKCAPSRTEDC